MARETWVQSPVESSQMILNTTLLNTQHYKVRVKWSNPGKGVAPSPAPWCSIFESTSTTVTNFTYFHYYKARSDAISNKRIIDSYTNQNVKATRRLVKQLQYIGLFLFSFMEYKPSLVIECKINVYTYKQFYFKQFTLAEVQSFFFFCLDAVKCKNGSILNNSVLHTYTVYMSKAVLFQAIQFNIRTHFSSIWLRHRNLSGATNLGHSEPGSDCNKEFLGIPQTSCINGDSLSDFLVSYQGHSLGESYPFAEMQSVYSAAPADWAVRSIINLSNFMIDKEVMNINFNV